MMETLTPSRGSPRLPGKEILQEHSEAPTQTASPFAKEDAKPPASPLQASEVKRQRTDDSAGLLPNGLPNTSQATNSADPPASPSKEHQITNGAVPPASPSKEPQIISGADPPASPSKEPQVTNGLLHNIANQPINGRAETKDKPPVTPNGQGHGSGDGPSTTSPSAPVSLHYSALLYLQRQICGAIAMLLPPDICIVCAS